MQSRTDLFKNDHRCAYSGIWFKNTGRHVWIQVISGRLTINGVPLETGDGAAIENADTLTLTGIENSEFLLFDLA